VPCYCLPCELGMPYAARSTKSNFVTHAMYKSLTSITSRAFTRHRSQYPSFPLCNLNEWHSSTPSQFAQLIGITGMDLHPAGERYILLCNRQRPWTSTFRVNCLRKLSYEATELTRQQHLEVLFAGHPPCETCHSCCPPSTKVPVQLYAKTACTL
jgi:hypothetical protein